LVAAYESSGGIGLGEDAGRSKLMSLRKVDRQMVRVHFPLRFLIQAVLLGACLVAGYFIAGWWWGTRDSTALAQICARIDYVNGLQEELQGQLSATQEVRDEF
jgi:hypothetical protein